MINSRFIWGKDMNLSDLTFCLCVVWRRKAKTSQEAARLAQVQKELSRIDALLTNDVCHLRNRIEEASIKFMDAQ